VKKIDGKGRLIGERPDGEKYSIDNNIRNPARVNEEAAA
jgi:hypothetical protein